MTGFAVLVAACLPTTSNLVLFVLIGIPVQECGIHDRDTVTQGSVTANSLRWRVSFWINLFHLLRIHGQSPLHGQRC